MTVTVIVGPRTRLAQELLATSWMRERRPVLLARDEDDVHELTSSEPRASVVRMWQTSWNLPPARAGVVVFCCALGPIHPAPSDFESSSRMALRDIEAVERILDQCVGRPVHVVLVSSVVALAPRADRRQYAAWKCQMEAALGRLVDLDAQRSLAVLYPGRLVVRRRFDRPTSLLASTYRRLVAVMIRCSVPTGPSRAVVGWDARAWLVMRGLVTWWIALRGR